MELPHPFHCAAARRRGLPHCCACPNTNTLSSASYRSSRVDGRFVGRQQLRGRTHSGRKRRPRSRPRPSLISHHTQLYHTLWRPRVQLMRYSAMNQSTIVSYIVQLSSSSCAVLVLNLIGLFALLSSSPAVASRNNFPQRGERTT